jgi:hypothetical protein
LLNLSSLAIQGAETTVVMGLEGAHAEFVGEGKDLLIVGFGLLDLGRVAMPRCPFRKSYASRFRSG